jgi:hypothetical protein
MDIDEIATSARLAVPNHGADDSENIFFAAGTFPDSAIS